MKALERLTRYGTKAYAEMQGIEWTEEFHNKYVKKYKINFFKNRPINRWLLNKILKIKRR